MIHEKVQLSYNVINHVLAGLSYRSGLYSSIARTVTQSYNHVEIIANTYCTSTVKYVYNVKTCATQVVDPNIQTGNQLVRFMKLI